MSTRYYRDIQVLSVDGRFCASAKSADNDAGRAFAADFTYTLTEAATGAVRWTRHQPRRGLNGRAAHHQFEASPVALHVHTDGRVAARLGNDLLLLLDPRDGHTLAQVPVFAAFPRCERALFARKTMQGFAWSTHAARYFLAVNLEWTRRPLRTYFVVRPRWNKRLVIDSFSGKLVDLKRFRDAAGEAHLSGAPRHIRAIMLAAIAEEARLALATLAAARSSGPEEWPRGLGVALHTVRFLRLFAAEADVRCCEAALREGSAASELIRRTVIETVRGLGLTPRSVHGDAAHGLESLSTADAGVLEDAIVQRVERADKVRAGMSLQEVAGLIGPPDARVGSHAFDYDMDAKEPFTLRVLLDASGRVAEVNRISPFAFLHDPDRISEH